MSIFRQRRNRGAAGYMAQVIQAGLKQTPGAVSVVEVTHASDCPRPRGGECTCSEDEIEVRLRPLLDPGRN